MATSLIRAKVIGIWTSGVPIPSWCEVSTSQRESEVVHRAHLNVSSPRFNYVQCSLNGRFRAAGVDYNVDCVDPASLLKTKFFHHRVSTTFRIFHAGLVWVSRRREEYVSCCVIFRKLKSRGYNVDCDHSDRADCFCDCHAKETHRTSPPHGDSLGSAEAGDVCNCVNRDGEGFDLRSESTGEKAIRGIGERTNAASSRVML